MPIRGFKFIYFETHIMTFLQILGTIVVLLVLSTVAESIRRIYFHPLSHIPGPKLAGLTWWYEFYFDGIQQGRYIFKIQELHKQYGKSLANRSRTLVSMKLVLQKTNSDLFIH